MGLTMLIPETGRTLDIEVLIQVPGARDRRVVEGDAGELEYIACINTQDPYLAQLLCDIHTLQQALRRIQVGVEFDACRQMLEGRIVHLQRQAREHTQEHAAVEQAA